MRPRQTALLLDPNFGADGIADYLIKRGIKVFRLGSSMPRRGSSDGEEFIAGDYSDLSLAESVYRQLMPTFVLPGCTDKSLSTHVKLSERLGLSGGVSPRAFSRIEDKRKLHSFLREVGVSHPRLHDNAKALESPPKLPIIVKPADSFSGKGITFLDRPSNKSLREAVEFAEQHSPSGSSVIQDFVRGDLYSAGAMVKGSKIIEQFVVREHCVRNPFRVDFSYLASESDNLKISDIRPSLSRLVRGLEMSNGYLHVQFLRSRSLLKVIEVFLRMPGDAYDKLVSFGCGIELPAAYASGFGVPWNVPANVQKIESKNAIRVTLPATVMSSFIELQESHVSVVEILGGYQQDAEARQVAILVGNSELNPTTIEHKMRAVLAQHSA